MPTRPSDDRSDARTEARRRARMAARGELPEEEPETAEAEAEPASGRGGFLTRIFPPAPPLPNRPDPLAGFNREGPLRPVREALFLLRHNLLAWLVPGIIAFFGYFASVFYGNALLGYLGSFVMFGGLIAAGWFGWQRPWLFGLVAGLLSYFPVAALEFSLFGTAGPFVARILLGLLYQGGFGFIGGWYGGYLRRRQTQLNAGNTRRR